MSEDNNDSKITLSRRKALAGIGGIGLASIGAGYGTFAAFSDSETGQATFTAGELDGAVSWSASYNGGQVGSGPQLEEQQGSFSTFDEGSAATYFNYNLDDVKPGDYGSLVFGIEVQTNPAWVFSCLDFDNNTDGSITDPEADADSVTGSDEYSANVVVNSSNFASQNSQTINYGNGEMADNLLLMPFYDSNVNSSFFDSGGTPSDFNPTNAGATSAAFWDNAAGTYLPRPLSEAAFAPLSQGTVGWNDDAETYSIQSPVQTQFNGCVLLNGAQGGDTQNQQEFSALNPGDTIQFGYDWHVPFNVGNELQSDTLDLKFGFNFQQVRHNASPANPYISTPGYKAQAVTSEGDDTSTPTSSP